MPNGTGVPAFGFGKKRGRKEDLRSWKGAAHGFRNLSVIKIREPFEQQINQLKTKNDEIVNKLKFAENCPDTGIHYIIGPVSQGFPQQGIFRQAPVGDGPGPGIGARCQQSAHGGKSPDILKGAS